jgi:hypothetical protein
MTQPGYRHRIVIQDRSYSMLEILEGAQSGFREFAAGEAAQPGKVTFSLWDFDTEIRELVSFGTPEQVRGYEIEPRGSTALYDAVGTAVVTEGTRLSALPEDERPEDVTVLVASDGEENMSQTWGAAAVRELLRMQQETYGWRVLYMGCGEAAFKEGERIGSSSGLTVNTVRSNPGQRNAWKMSSDYLGRVPVAAAAVGSLGLTDDERALGESEEEDETAG